MVPGEKHFVSRTAWYTIVDFKINSEIMRELQIPQVIEFREVRFNWKETLPTWALTGLQKSTSNINQNKNKLQRSLKWQQGSVLK